MSNEIDDQLKDMAMKNINLNTKLIALEARCEKYEKALKDIAGRQSIMSCSCALDDIALDALDTPTLDETLSKAGKI